MTYVAGRDHYRVTLVNDKPFRGSLEQLGRDRSWGEFGGLMPEILDPRRDAAFQWDRWEVLHGRRMAVLRYRVDLAHSHYLLRVPSPAGRAPRGNRGPSQPPTAASSMSTPRQALSDV